MGCLSALCLLCDLGQKLNLSELASASLTEISPPSQGCSESLMGYPRGAGLSPESCGYNSEPRGQGSGNFSQSWGFEGCLGIPEVEKLREPPS